jgi:hypothetical protein
MSEEHDKDSIIDMVIEDIKADAAKGDLTVVAELLDFVPYDDLVNSLSDEQKVINNIKLT